MCMYGSSMVVEYGRYIVENFLSEFFVDKSFSYQIIINIWKLKLIREKN